VARWFTIALGLLGWGVVVGLPAAGLLPEPAWASAPWIALFVVVILAARALAFRVVEGTVLSLDSSYYVAAAVCVGSVAAGRLVAVALTIDASARLYKRRHLIDRGVRVTEVGYLLYFGGVRGRLIPRPGAGRVRRAGR
jgi:hypothetical protein